MTSLPPGSKPGDQLRFDSLASMTGVTRYLVYYWTAYGVKNAYEPTGVKHPSGTRSKQ